jgi:hypothetical protein
MRRLLLLVAISAITLSGAGFAQARKKQPRRGMAVAFFDIERLQSPEGESAMEDFEFYFHQIRQIVTRDFPNVQLRILTKGELLSLPNGDRLNVQNMRPEIGYVLSAPGKKQRVLTGIQTDADFACAAATFFQRKSPACPK